MSFLYLLESIRNPFLDVVVQLITHLGSEMLFIVVGIFMLWCMDKKQGYFILLTGFFGVYLNQFLKILCRVPRPWVLDPDFTIVESARAEATGYSFPSGHSQNIATLGTYFSERVRKVWFIVAASILILLVGFSRMYLGVHYPSDVIVGVILGVSVTIGFGILYDKAKNKNLLMLIMLITLVPFFIAFMFEKDDNALSLAANFYKMFGMFSGLLVGSLFEENVVKYDISGPIWKKALRVVIVVGLVLAVKEGFKLLYKGAGIEVSLIMDSIRYFIMLFVSLGLCPLLFKKIKL